MALKAVQDRKDWVVRIRFSKQVDLEHFDRLMKILAVHEQTLAQFLVEQSIILTAANKKLFEKRSVIEKIKFSESMRNRQVLKKRGRPFRTERRVLSAPIDDWVDQATMREMVEKEYGWKPHFADMARWRRLKWRVNRHYHVIGNGSGNNQYIYNHRALMDNFFRKETNHRLRREKNRLKREAREAKKPVNVSTEAVHNPSYWENEHGGFNL